MRDLGLAFVAIIATFVITNASAEPIKVVEEPVIYSNTAVVEEPAAIVEEAIAPVNAQKARYGFTNEEVYLLAQLLCGDKDRSGDGEYDIDFKKPENISRYEISKVLCVVMNRVRDDRFHADTVTDVVLAKNQFSVMPKNLKAVPSDIAIQYVREWCEAYDRFDAGAQTIPENHVFFSGNGYTNTTRP